MPPKKVPVSKKKKGQASQSQLKTCKRNSSIKMDRISVLPKNIIDSILTCLPILEAVRTSILSRSWRYQWHSLSKLDINQVSLPKFDDEIVKIIDYILLVHCGSVDMFALNIKLETCYVIDRWILYVSRNGIKELAINISDGEHYNLPSCFFLCSDLTYLELTKCVYKHPPAEFKAFVNLTELFFDQVVISDEGLDNLLNSCPLLSRLSLLTINPPPSVKINAPNLVMLHITLFYSYSQFKYTPFLTSASFELQNPALDDRDCEIVELLGSLPVLQTLHFYEYAWQHLAVGDVPERLPLVCPVKHLTASINFEDLQELLAALCMFRSSPFIQTLDLSVCSRQQDVRISTDGFWQGEHDFCFRFDHLLEVVVDDFSGTETELKLIEFLLANAPVLETMKITFEDHKDVKDLFTIVTRLIQFPRVSPKASLILPSYPNLS